MTRKVVIDWAADDRADARHRQYRVEKVTAVRTRRHALWLLRQGPGPTAVAEAVGVSRHAIQLWRRGYRSGGLAEVRSPRQGGQGTPCYLTEAQQAQGVAEAATGVFATAQAVRDGLEAPCGVVYTVGSLYTLLPRLGIRLQGPRARHTKAAPQVQATGKKGGSANV